MFAKHFNEPDEENSVAQKVKRDARVGRENLVEVMNPLRASRGMRMEKEDARGRQSHGDARCDDRAEPGCEEASVLVL